MEAIVGARATSPKVIIVGAGMSGISAAETLSDAGINDILILEATDRIGGRICKTDFGGINVEMGANWVEGVNGSQTNPIWKMAKELGLHTFYSDYSKLSSNTYKQDGGLYENSLVKDVIKTSEDTYEEGGQYSKTLPTSGRDDVSILTFQRLQDNVPSDPLDMVVDFFQYDYEYAEPPRTTSLQNCLPLPTFANFGDDIYLVADQRGYESVVHHVAQQFLKTDDNGTIDDPRLLLNKVVRSIRRSFLPEAETLKEPVSASTLFKWTVTTEDGSVYVADYVMVSVSIGVLQTKLIKFVPPLPPQKLVAIYKFDMAVYTKIFLKFPCSFWPKELDRQFFLYASERRGYYPVWQHFEKEYPGENILLVTVTDDESRRIEQQSDLVTMAEAMEVLKSMFGQDIPDAIDILVPQWWSDRFYKGSYSNWPLGVNRYEFDLIKEPVSGSLFFTGEHTSEQYNGFVHGAYLAGIGSAKLLLKYIKKPGYKFTIKPKDAKD